MIIDNELDERNSEILSAISEWFNNFGVMTIEDFDNICYEIDKSVGEWRE